jgi:uncharacterized membrane protein YgcG
MFGWPRRDSNKQFHLPDELLSAYLDGEVTAQERARVASHLATCASCRESLQSLRDTVTLVKALPRMPVPRAFTLTEEMVGLRPTRARTPWIAVYLRGMSAVAALLLIVLLGGDLFLRSGQPAPQTVAVQWPVEAQPGEQPTRTVEKAAIVPTDAARETREAAAALAFAPEATRPEQEEGTKRVAGEEATATPQPTQRPSPPPPAPAAGWPRGAGGAGGGGAEGGGMEGGGGGSDLGPGVEPVPTEAPPQPEETAVALTEEAAAKTVKPDMRSAAVVAPSPEPTAPPTPTSTAAPPAETAATPGAEEARKVLGAPTATPPSLPLEKTTEVAQAVGEPPTPPPEPTTTLLAPQPKRAGAEPGPRFAWETPLRIAEVSLAVLIVLLLTASWVAARRT